MPSSPEDGGRCREKWTIKVFGQSYGEHTGGSDDHMRVTRKIKKEQKSVPNPQQPNIDTTPSTLDLIKSGVDACSGRPTGRQHLRQHKLHRKPLEHPNTACGEILPSQARKLAELRQHLRQTAHGTREYRWPECHIETKLEHGR